MTDHNSHDDHVDPILSYMEKMAKIIDLFGNPECPNCGSKPPDEMDVAVAKVKARTALNGRKGKIIIPDREEMLGIHLLDRDDQLRPERKDR